MRLFPRFVLSFLAASLSGTLLLLAFVFGAYGKSSADWTASRELAIREAAVALLRDGEDSAIRALDADIPVFVYDPEGNLVASNRGAGRRRPPGTDKRVPLQEGERLLGWIDSGEVNFHADESNRALLQTMLTALIWGTSVSLLVSLALAFLLARSVALPARRLEAALRGLASGDKTRPLQPSGPLELRRIAHSAEDLRVQLLDEERLRAQWVQDVVHDLRTPVAALGAQLEALADGVLAPDPGRLRRLQGETSRLATLVSSLEELMRLEAGGPAAAPEAVELVPFLDSLIERFAPAAAAKAQSLERDLEPLSVRADALLLDRALSNVLSNAVSYAPSQARVRVSARRGAGAMIEIDIENSGTRLTDQETERVFDRLYRGEYARDAAGSGLGLSIARRIARLHGGDLVALSRTDESGDAVIFRFTLPESSSQNLHAPFAEA